MMGTLCTPKLEQASRCSGGQRHACPMWAAQFSVGNSIFSNKDKEWILPWLVRSRPVHLPCFSWREGSNGVTGSALHGRRCSDGPTHLPPLADSPSTLSRCKGNSWVCLGDLTYVPSQSSFPQVILMERENAEEWAESYMGMLDFYKENIRPWYLPQPLYTCLAKNKSWPLPCPFS